MRIFRIVAFSVASLAVAANPLLARLIPCCCASQDRAKAAEKAHGRCQHIPAADSVLPEHACCAREQGPIVVELTSSCCCETTHSSPIPARDTVTGREIGGGLADLLSHDHPRQLGAWRNVVPSADDGLLSGPSLLALYCIWLK